MTVEVPKLEIISLLSCAEDYGFDHSILMSALVEMLGGIDDKDVNTYIDMLLVDPNYTEEDRECILERFEFIKEKYCN